MTNQPDESHPMRDRVDKAISWFTETDEPDETGTEPVGGGLRGETPAPAVDSPAPDSPASSVNRTDEGAATAEDAGARTDERVPAPDGTRRPEEEAPVAAVGPVAPLAREDTPRVDAAAAGTEERVGQENAVSDDGTQVTEGAHPEATPLTAAAEPGRVEPTGTEEGTHGYAQEPPASWAEVHPNARHLPPDHAVDSEAGRTGSQRSLYRDEAPTLAMPAAVAAAAAAGAGTGAAAGRGEPTAVMDGNEFARLRREERAARDRQLGKVIAAPEDAAEPVATRYPLPTTYKGLPSFGFLVFRLVVAAVVGIRAWQHVTHLSATRATWAATVMPRPDIAAYAQIGLEIVIAVMLVIGLGTRIAGLLLLVLSVVSLAFVQWGAVNPFQPGANDFIGVVDVLLAGAGLLFATTGGGRAAFDGAIHSDRIRRKNDRLLA